MASRDLSEALVDSINASYGSHPGHRAAHAKGVLCGGTFTAAAGAASLSRAQHLTATEPTRVHVRFSNGGGNPTVGDAARDGRGMAVKWYLPDGTTTDVVAITLPLFFARTPEDLLAFNDARRPDPTTGQVDVAKVGAYLAGHPEAVPAVTAAMTHVIPASYATIGYHALHAFGFVSGDGVVRHGRYHFIPVAGDASLSDDDAAAADDHYLRDELEARLTRGPVRFELEVELAGGGDPIDDPTAPWSDDRERVTLGRIDITALAFDRERDGDILVFDPSRVTEGLELTADPILLARPGAYSVSVARRTASSG